MTHYDLAIIGTGSGNSLVTPDFDDKRVAVIERATFGGTCLNVGCIPTKMFVYAAEVAETVRGASKYGIDARIDDVRWRDIRDRVFGRIDPIAEGGRDYRVNGPNTTAYLGSARFTGPHSLIVDVAGEEHEVTADQIVIATGARPVIPEVIRASGVRYYTNDDVMRLDELPASMVILGGGFIASEFAHVFSALGVRVSIVTRGPAMLRAEDETVSEAFTREAQRRWDVHLSASVTGAREEGGEVVLTCADGEQVRGELLLVATGREPVSADLNLPAAGVETHVDGRVKVDAYGRTTAAGVWSLGDASSAYQLKHVANHEARIVAHNLAHPDDLRAFDHRFVPSAVFTDPQIASVGLTEREAEEAGAKLTVKVQYFGDTAYGWAMEDTSSFLKLIADRRTGRLLGAHIMGPFASSLIQPLIQAMSFEQDARTLARGQYWIHPALAEVVENALLGLEFD
ncbi:mycothione reductase [Calidifontibacter sp. DB0510]|uniref:Mycothione reductase n=1 Tax=Metallococcus carri TaxID=1656884 RepID=A0A967AZN5_9MICO|nr:mycothione reductase [Metallococcus carri]NHN54565.1 mycothione reductase [Metallococcus carri]NOP36596.1 mycothione reductase [Calidifontibacter sp. DB2511S]